MDVIEITETRFKNTLFDKEFSDFMYENRVKINGKKRKKKDFFLDLSFAEINDFYTFNEYVIKILDHLNLDINTDEIKLIINIRSLEGVKTVYNFILTNKEIQEFVGNEILKYLKDNKYIELDDYSTPIIIEEIYKKLEEKSILNKNDKNYFKNNKIHLEKQYFKQFVREIILKQFPKYELIKKDNEIIEYYSLFAFFDKEAFFDEYNIKH